MERSLRENGVSPYRSNSLVHVSDLYATILGLASSKEEPLYKSTPSHQKSISTATKYSPLCNDNEESTDDNLHLHEGINQMHYLIQGGELNTHQACPPPRNAILHGKNEYQVSSFYASFFHVTIFELVICYYA